MTLPLPLFVAFLVTVGWEAVPHWTRVATQQVPQGEATARGAGFAWLPAAPVCSTSANTDSGAWAPPSLAPWAQLPSWDLPSPVLERPAPSGPADSLSLPSAGWPPAALMPTPDQPGDQVFRIPLAGPVFLFGQAEKDSLTTSQGSRFVGQTGVTCKLPVQAGVELLFSCGPELTYTDVFRPDRLQERPSIPFQTRLLRLDVQCRWRLLGQVGLECQGSVCPALNPGEQDTFRQDLHLAFPLTGGGWFNLGAKHYWERSPDAKPVPESGQLYGDFRLIW